MIRWDEPIEAYHTDGRVASAAVREGGPHIANGCYWVMSSEYSNWVMPKDDFLGWGWRIRNVPANPQAPRQAPKTTPTAPNTPVGYSDEVVGKMEAFVRRFIDWHNDVPETWFPDLMKEARAIVALIEPVDPDETAANEVCRAIGFTSLDPASDVRKVALAAIRRGRALAAEGR